MAVTGFTPVRFMKFISPELYTCQVYEIYLTWGKSI